MTLTNLSKLTCDEIACMLTGRVISSQCFHRLKNRMGLQVQCFVGTPSLNGRSAAMKAPEIRNRPALVQVS